MPGLPGGRRAALRAGRLPPASEDERLAPLADATERFLYGLRLREGVSPSGFARRHPAAAPRAAEWEARLAKLEDVGVVRHAGDRWCLTPRGTEVCDAVLAELA